MEQLNVAIPEQTVLMTPVDRAFQLVQDLVVDSSEMKSIAADELKGIKSRYDALESQRDSLVRPLNTVVSRINALFRPALDRLKMAETTLKGKILAYDRVEAEKAAAAQRAAMEAARKERERLAAEAARVQAKADEEARKLRERADEAAAAGNAAKAAELQSRAESREDAASSKAAELTMAAQIVTHVAAPAPAKVAGLSTRKVWKARVTDKAAAITAMAQNPALLALIDINESGLNQYARATKGAAPIAGIEFYEDETLASRRAA